MADSDMPDDTDLLGEYRKKRDFNSTPEPSHHGKPGKNVLRFVVQKHWARSLHYDFRLEFAGTLKSWAVPKGPSLDPHVKRMAVEVEDHPLSYAEFEGVIPAKQYGAGRVMVWDTGSWLPAGDAAQAFKDGKLKFELRGAKLKGRWTLVRMRRNSNTDNDKQVAWLLIKEHDEYERPIDQYDITVALPDSVAPVVPTTLNGLPVPAGAVKSVLPLELAPQLATLVVSPPIDGHWLYELKLDGYRLLSRLDGGSVKCCTRNGHDWTAKMPLLAQSLTALGLTGTWLDGEIVVLNQHGVPEFQLLQRAFEADKGTDCKGAAAIVYFVFDMPFFNGHDLRGVALDQRRALLQGLLEKHAFSNIQFSAVFEATPRELMASACKLGLEGLIGKRADSLYHAGRSRDWIKLKCGQRQTFLVCGYTDPKGSRTGLGALLLGQRDESGELQYAGNVGTGFSEKVLTQLLQSLKKLATVAAPFEGKASAPGKPHWVKPVLLADVSFIEWTNTGRIRHGVFHGLTADRKPHEVKPEAPAQEMNQQKLTSRRAASIKPSATAASVISASLRITHADRVIDEQSGLTKLDVVKHYAAVAALMLPHLSGRPVSLVRAPDGTGGGLFFQKHATAAEIPGVKLLSDTLDPGHASLLEITSAPALLNAAQMNTIEFHTWNAVAANIAKPDRMIFDIDPGDSVAWPDVQEAAWLVRTLLEALGLKCFIKTSGGKGLHVVVPLKRLHSWDLVRGFSQAVVQHLAKTIPQKFVAKSGPQNRIGKIFVDYLRNGFGATTVCAWSARARPGLGVSVPVAWDELQQLTSGAHWTVRNVQERLQMGNSVWDGYKASAHSLRASMKLLGYKES